MAAEPARVQVAWRTGLAVALLVVSTWLAARLVSREEYEMVPLMVGPAVGAAVGWLRRRSVIAALVSAAIGLNAALLLMVLDAFLWLAFTLPPYLKYDL